MPNIRTADTLSLARSVGGSTFAHISTITVLSATTQLSFSNIPQEYTNLIALFSGTLDSAGTAKLILNGASANYKEMVINQTTSSTIISESSQTSYFHLKNTTVSGGTGVTFYAVTIPNYSGLENMKYLLIDSYYHTGTSPQNFHIAGILKDTSSITSLAIGSSGPNFSIGSVMSIYGSK